MKTFKLIFFIALFAILANGSKASDAEFNIAKRNLNESIQTTIKNDFKKTGNFLYENDINKIKEVVTILFKVDKSQNIKLVNVECKNCDASAYIKYLFNKYEFKADPILCNRYYRMNIRLSYMAK